MIVPKMMGSTSASTWLTAASSSASAASRACGRRYVQRRCMRLSSARRVLVPVPGRGFGLLHDVQPQAGRVDDREAALSPGLVAQRVGDLRAGGLQLGEGGARVVDLQREEGAPAVELLRARRVRRVVGRHEGD